MSNDPVTRITINAPIATVWRALTDFDAYPEWNPWVRFTGHPRPGAEVPMTIKLFGRALTVTVHIEAVDEERELRWRGGPPRLMSGAHFFELRPLDAGSTELVQGERFRGLGAPILWPLLRSELMAFYGRINRALKARAERVG